MLCFPDYVERRRGFQPRAVQNSLTCGGRQERHRFGFFSIIVDGQVPDTRVHVLNKTCVVCGDGYQTPLHSCGPLHASDVLHQEPPPIQEFYKVKLRQKNKPDFREIWRLATGAANQLEFHLRLKGFQASL